MAAVQAAEEALNRAAEEAGAPAVAGEVQVTVAAARAAARNAMESLRRDEAEFGGEGERDVLTPRQVSCVSVLGGSQWLAVFLWLFGRRAGLFVVASRRYRLHATFLPLLCPFVCCCATHALLLFPV